MFVNDIAMVMSTSLPFGIPLIACLNHYSYKRGIYQNKIGPCDYGIHIYVICEYDIVLDWYLIIMNLYVERI